MPDVGIGVHKTALCNDFRPILPQNLRFGIPLIAGYPYIGGIPRGRGVRVKPRNHLLTRGRLFSIIYGTEPAALFLRENLT